MIMCARFALGAAFFAQFPTPGSRRLRCGAFPFCIAPANLDSASFSNALIPRQRSLSVYINIRARNFNSVRSSVAIPLILVTSRFASPNENQMTFLVECRHVVTFFKFAKCEFVFKHF